MSVPRSLHLALIGLSLALAPWFPSAQAASLKEVITRIKPGIVAVGTYQETRRPPAAFLGTGFVVGDGRTVVTALHVLPKLLDQAHREGLVVFQRSGGQLAVRGARLRASDAPHDIALLAIDGTPLPPLTLAAGETQAEGEEIAITGFPIGAVLGLHPVTHRGIIAAITPFASQALDARQLDAQTIRSLQQGDPVYQLDATVFPGNSGSPVYLTGSGEVIAMMNSTFVKGAKEYALTDPSGISYAIPIGHVTRLLAQSGP